MNRALVGTLESAPPGTSAAQLRERLRAPVVLEQLRRADPECMPRRGSKSPLRRGSPGGGLFSGS